ncbi:YdcF family protein [Comamonas sp. F1-6]|uniref:YdcF family protein n=1 Tax=Comamonas sp. F1-6 TaxID=673550 RepID=UPI0031E22196
MTLKADTPISRSARCARALLALLGALLLADALVLMGMGHFNVGVVLPAMLGAGAFWLSWKWRSVQHWRASRPLSQRLWSLGWVILALWLISLFWFWSRLSGLGLSPQQVPPVQSIVVLGSGTLDGYPRPVLAERGVAADAPMAMVSSDFHLMRAMDIAKRQDLPEVYPVAAPTPLATRFNAWLREYFAMASSWLLGEV